MIQKTCNKLFCLTLFFSSTLHFAEENFYCLGDGAVVLEYASIYDVHTEPDPVNYPNPRAHPATFSERTILKELRKYLHTEKYDFVLLYSLQELPGWIHSGGNYSQPLGKNIGSNNDGSGHSWAPEGWAGLRSVPHMNDVAFISRTSENNQNYGGALTVFHECFHYWGPNMTHNYSIGPREWTSDLPVAWLGQSSLHWSWNFIDTPEFDLPGIMASGPTSDQFNAFDLYIMGLLGYDQASEYIYTVYEIDDETKHDITLDDLIYAMSLLAPYYYEGDGKRIPDIDPTAAHFNCLVVVVKGIDETLTEEDVDLVLNMVDDIPGAWSIATWGLSSMTVQNERRMDSLRDPAGNNLELANPGFNFARFLDDGKNYDFYASQNLKDWEKIERIKGEGRVVQRFFKESLPGMFYTVVEVPQ